MLQTPEDHELYSCETVEQTPFYFWDCIVQGKARRSECFFQRDPAAGRVTFVGERLWGTSCPPKRIAGLDCKFVFHPFGRTCGSRMDPAAFQEAMEVSEETGSYGPLTALMVSMTDGILEPARYPDKESRAALLMRLRECWGKARICSSVAIIVWQRYFDLLRIGDSDVASSAVVQDILRWMPLMANKASPSRLVEVLTRCGWLLQDDLFVVPEPSVPDSVASDQSQPEPVGEGAGEELESAVSTLCQRSLAVAIDDYVRLQGECGSRWRRSRPSQGETHVCARQLQAAVTRL